RAGRRRLPSTWRVPPGRPRRAPIRPAPGPGPAPAAHRCHGDEPNRCRRPAVGHGAGPAGVLHRRSQAATLTTHIRTPNDRRHARRYLGPRPSPSAALDLTARPTMPDAPRPRKPNRLWLFAPFVAVAVAFA